MRATLRGQRWTINRGKVAADLDGECDYARKRVVISKHCTDPKELLETVIHETLHACLPDLHEDSVHESAADIARVLFSLGARIEL